MPATYPRPPMSRHELLTGLHRRLRPRTYLEIGVNTGASLALSRARSVGVDPAFKVVTELQAPVRLARATSDDYFAANDPKAWLGAPIDLAFIDGMHLFEFALRDFMNVERHSRWSTAVVLDDMLPRDVPEAARDRHTKFWAGDVFWVAEALREYRPDLRIIPVNTSPTGTVVILGLDPTSTLLERRYDEVIERFSHPDPQPVPVPVLERKGAVDPRVLLRSPVWGCLYRGRLPLHPRDKGLAEIEQALDHPDEYRTRRRAARERAQRLLGDVRSRLPRR
ncbi:class I SAM-dependent methyltransferase [Cellulosimicrobium terreum]|nr:class I SAM-dependent methyltransferase [Cellulosimicrobium terreum]